MIWHGLKLTFDRNVESVLELLNFDRAITEIAVDGLRSAAKDIENTHKLYRVAMMLNNRADMLAQVRRGDSLRPQYEKIFNQCVVLLVSYFDSAVHGIFRGGVETALREGCAVPVATTTFSISWNSLEQTQGGRERIFADLLVAQKNISFQDMQSIVRAFKDHLGIPLERTTLTDDIIFGQASRHDIVHAGGIIDERMIKQVSGATLRTLKPHVVCGHPLHFTTEEIAGLAKSMQLYVETLCAALDKQITQADTRNESHAGD